MHAILIGRTALAAAALLLLTGCGAEQKPAYDWRNRDLSWKHGPTDTATPEHLACTGQQGGKKISAGWKCELQGGTRLTVRPVDLADEHPMFGKARLVIELFDKDSQRLPHVSSDPITREQASFTFEIDEDTGRRLWDLIIWYREV
jgi:hypothetical protein